MTEFLDGKLRGHSGPISRIFDQLIERIERNINWLDRYKASISLWLTQYSEDISNFTSIRLP